MSAALAADSSQSDFVIQTKNLSKSYRHGWFGREKFHALRDVDLNVRRGEVFGLLGPNGAGKTTLIKLLLGIVHPSSGQAQVLGENAGSQHARRRIGYLPENLVFPRHHTGEGALQFYGRLSGLSENAIRKQMKPLLEVVGLLGREREPVRKYSKGMRQRLGLAQAMLHDPEILILDEPTDGLDPLGRSQIRKLIERLKQSGKSVFLNSHILQEVELVCDRVAIMAHGKIRAVGNIESLIDQHTHARSVDVWLEVAGDENTCRQLFVGTDVQTLESLGKLGASIESLDALHIADEAALQRTRFRVQLKIDELSQSDAWVDRIRSAGLSLISLQPQRLRLEDIFVRLVASLEADSQVATRSK
ncbi:MAG: ABC transporter ATP-binding protein [Pirellulaceae bacterium]|nr:ABC transporter ATP-binding protein [Pirellulaceae bacterium]